LTVSCEYRYKLSYAVNVNVKSVNKLGNRGATAKELRLRIIFRLHAPVVLLVHPSYVDVAQTPGHLWEVI